MGGYYYLMEAIVEMACKDYIKAYKKKDIIECQNIERFFRSDWFSFMFDIDPDYILEKLERKAKHGRKKA